MPTKPKRPCGYPRCPALTVDRYCDKHRKQEHQAYKQQRTDKDEQAFYNSTPWRKVRAMKLRQDPLCEECGKQGRIKEAALVHHLQEIKDGGERLAFDNLQSVCTACHNKLHGLRDRRSLRPE